MKALSDVSFGGIMILDHGCGLVGGRNAQTTPVSLT